MKYVFLIGAFNALFFLVLLLQKKPKFLYDRILVFWLLYLGLYTAAYSSFSEDLFQYHHVLSVSFISLLMLHGPFLYLYVSSFTFKENSLSLKDYQHFLPFILFNIYLLTELRIPGIENTIRMDHVPTEDRPPAVFIFFLVLTAISGPAYFILSILLFRKLDKNIRNNFSYSNNIDLGWMRNLILIFGIIWTVFMIFASLYHIFHLFSIDFCTNGLFLSLSAFIVLVGYFGLRQKEIFIHYPDNEQEYVLDPPKKYSGYLLKEEDAVLYREKLIQYMKLSKPYLDPDLTLPGLAASINIPSYYLSRILNERLNQNFFDFVNSYRIEDVKSKIADTRFVNYSILGIAFESGFNSKSAFNRIFKKITGQTPSRYRQSVLNSKSF